jgi:general secretion pathway protein H
MPTSAPGSSARQRQRHRLRHRSAAARGFTLIELLIVIAVVAIAVGVMTLSLRDGSAARLEEEAARLAALLEIARAEARASGSVVRWAPVSAGLPNDDGAQFRFVGLPAAQPMPKRWLDAATSAEVVGASALVLGPEAILPAQRVVLRLGEHHVDISSDGLAPFAQTASGESAVAR